MGQIDDLLRYDGRRVVVTGCASGIGEHVARQLAELGAEVVGLDLRRPALQLKEFHEIDLSDPASVDQAAASIDGQVDALFNIAGVSSAIGDPLRVVAINFLGTRQFTEALVPTMPPGSAIANVSSLAAAAYRENATVTVGLVDTVTMAEGIEWCRRNPEAVADGGGYRLSKEAMILYGMAKVVVLGAKGFGSTAPPRESPIHPSSTSSGRPTDRSSWTLSRPPSAAWRAPTSRRACWYSSIAARRPTSPAR